MTHHAELFGHIINDLIRDIPDFPKPGITFKDITPLIHDSKALLEVTRALARPWFELALETKVPIDYVAGMESRGFIFGVPLAIELGCGFIPLRKPGKLPYKTISQDYGLEYGKDTLEIHEDACPEQENGRRANVLICDDLLATGGTAVAAAQLIKQVGGVVTGFSFVVELTYLEGHEKLQVQQNGFAGEEMYPIRLESLIKYDD